MSGSKGSSGQQSVSTSQNIGTALLANLFGQGAGFGPQGVQFGSQFGTQFAQPVFEASDFSGLGNIINPTPASELQLAAPGVAQAGLEGLSGRVQQAQDIINPALAEGVQTGFRTDIAPIVAEEQRRFRSETVPQLAEQFSGLTGGFSSDFQRALGGASTDLGVRLGSQQAGLDEAANTRRSQFAAVAPSLFSQTATLGPSIGADLQTAGAQLQEDAFLRRPEVQMLRSLTNLFTAAPVTQGSSTFARSNNKGGGV